MTDKFCSNCKFCSGNLSIARCDHPNNGKDLVTGTTRSYFATINRSASNLCGPEGKWYEDKPALEYKPSLFMRIIKRMLG